MTFPVPQIDHRSQEDLVREALGRVRYHTTEWTNLEDSDPGVTLVQLFAFVTENLNYRANLIPERNRAKFLQLLGLGLRPAAAARGLVALRNERGPLEEIVVDEDAEVQAGRVPFRLQHALTILPVEGRLYTKAKLSEDQRQAVEDLYTRLYEDLGNDLDYYETRVFQPAESGISLDVLDLAQDTVDGALWLALLARPGEEDLRAEVRKVLTGKILTLGVMPAVGESARRLPPGGGAEEKELGLVFELPRMAADGVGYRRLEARATADLTTRPGTVELTLPGSAAELTWEPDLDPLEAGVGELPPSLADSDDAARLITWIRIRSPHREDESRGGGPTVRLSGVWMNAAEAMQRARVELEQLPPGTGEPDQSATLVQTPVLPDSLRLTVNGQTWERIDDLATAAPEVPPGLPQAGKTAASSIQTSALSGTADARVYELDPASGEIRFGNGERGMRPPRGAVILVSYDYGGGREGLVGIGAIDRAPSLDAALKVTNPVAFWGGDEAESVADAEHRISQVVRHRDRLVSAQDFRDVTWGTPGVDLGRVEVLPLFHPQQPEAQTEGVVSLLLIPLFDPLHPDHPEPDRLFLDTVCRHLDPRRLITTELHLRGPEYQDLWVSVGVEILAGREQGPVLEQVENEMRRFLSPLAGGFEQQGWPLGRTVEVGELQAVATRVPGVARLGSVLLGNAAGASLTELPIRGLELPRLAGLAVTSGEPLPLEDLLGTPSDAAPSPRLPVPVVPEEC